MDLRKAKYILPNMFTLASVFTGFYSMLITLSADSAAELTTAAWLICISMIFDGLDGRVARATKTQSAFGVQLDSLADGIAFGVAPAALIYQWGLQQLGGIGTFIAFAFIACGIMRLARFNVTASNSDGPALFFTGLPIPLAAGTLVSVVLAHTSLTGKMMTGAPWSVALLTLLLAGLMVSNFRYRTFKKVKLRGPAGFALAATLIAVVIISIQFKPGLAFVGVASMYIVLGIADTAIGFGRRVRDARSSGASSSALALEEDEDDDA